MLIGDILLSSSSIFRWPVVMGNSFKIQGFVSHLALLEVNFISMEDILCHAVLDLLVAAYIPRRLSWLVGSVHARQ